MNMPNRGDLLVQRAITLLYRDGVIDDAERAFLRDLEELALDIDLCSARLRTGRTPERLRGRAPHWPTAAD